MTRFLFSLLILVQIPAFCIAQDHFTWSPQALQAYDKVTHLRLKEALTTIQQIKQDDPGNLVVHHLENYIDFFTLYILEDKTAYKNRKPERDIRLAKIRKGDPKSPWNQFIQADIRMQWALLKFKFKDYLGGFQDVSKAHKLLTQNAAKFPEFLPNQKNLSILHALVGTVPKQYMWGIQLLTGLNGSIAQGRREMEGVLNDPEFPSFVFANEMKALYAYCLLHLANEPDAAWQYIQSAGFTPDQNPLHCFVMANIAMRSGHNDEAIELLTFQPNSRAMLPFDHLNFMLGLAKMHRLEMDADKHLLRFIDKFPGHTFRKEAYQKLAWHALIFESEERYYDYMQLCAQNGQLHTGSDKNAHKEALAGISPQVDLVKARLLFDGAYFTEALQILNAIDGEEFPEKRDQLEYYYRKGRIYHGLNNYSLAIWHYQQTIRRGENLSFFYACNAALQTALIYEKLEKKQHAETFFQRCLSMSPDEYQNSLHQKAKAGLDRLRNVNQ